MDMLVEVLGRVFCYPAGWLLLKVMTLGRWSGHSSWLSIKPDSEWVVGLGALVWAFVILFAFKQFG